MKRIVPLIIIVFLLGAVTIVSAQGQCEVLVREAINLVADTCVGLGRNQACHGYLRVDAEPREGISPFSFALGDIVDVSEVVSLRTYPLDVETEEWGIALMSLQANLPDELPGANATFLLIGDTEVDNTGGLGASPMQSIRLKTGITGTQCSEAPSNGLLIQTPHGVGRVTLNVNRVDISLGSTIFIDAVPGGLMTVSTLEGSAIVSLNGMNQTALPGYQVRIAMDDDMNPLGFVDAAGMYDAATMLNLPVTLLPRAIEVASPRTGDVLARVFTNDGSTTASANGTGSTGTGNCGNGVGSGSATCDVADSVRQNENTPDNNAGGNGGNPNK
ncbi:MAG: hypothetical protein KJ065_09830 [Anaerolineae bacterium]|nr:hypothetical protein [Anaerolineae bacterium]